MNRKLLKVYCFLLILAASTMIMLWQFYRMKKELPVRDYPAIKEEGVLRMAVLDQSINKNAFYLELSRNLSNRCGLEIQLLFYKSTEECTEALNKEVCDIIASSFANDSLSIPAIPWTLRENSPILRDSLNHWLQWMIQEGTYKELKDKYSL